MADLRNEVLALAEDYQETTLSSGVTVRFTTFPLRLYQKIMAQAEEKYPTPKPPKKKIKTLTGDEVVDNLTEPKYVAKAKAIQDERNQYTGERIGTAALELCIQVDLPSYEELITRLEKLSGEIFPENPYERKAKFLSDYALGSLGDWEIATAIPLAMMGIRDKEVAERIDSFRGDVARSETNGTQASSADAIKWVDVEQSVTEP